MTTDGPSGALTVLESFPRPRPTTNPYLARLPHELPDDVRVLTFDWRTALLGRYDVFHVHWPEKLVRGASPLRTAYRAAATTALLVRLALRRTPVVRTLHNSTPHEAGGRVERALVRALEARTSAWIVLSPGTRLPAHAPADAHVVTIPHPHYRDWYAEHPRPAARPGRVLFFGLVRPYKGVEDLLAAFAALPGDDLELRVVGSPESESLRRTVEELAARDARVGLRLSYVDDAELAAEVGASSVVVLPYRRLENSGAALLALSLDRPVLLPAGSTAEDLRDEVGTPWVDTFTYPLRAEDLRRALHRAGALTLGQDRPDLTRRDWAPVAAAHAAVFRAAAGRAPRSTPTPVATDEAAR